MKRPQLRFPGFTDDWEQRKLGELVSFSKGSGYSKGDLKETGTPIILYGRLYTKYETVISEVDTFVDANPGSVYSKGKEVIVPGSGETAEDISVASVVEKSGILLGGDLNVITPPEDLDSAFLAISISNGKPHNDMAKMAQGKSVVHLHNSDLAKIDFPYPSYTEQGKISGYFSNLDNLITLHQRKCDNLKDLKKAMLSKMFPREGKKRPEVRFPGFTDDWEQRKLGDCCGIFLGLTYTPQYVDKGITFISSKDIANDYLDLSEPKYISVEEYNKNSSNAKPVRGDILFTRVGSNLGHPVIIESDEKLCIFVSLGYLRPNNYIYNYFMKHWMNSSDFKTQLFQKTGGGAKVNVNTGWLKTFDFLYPQNIDEQKKIGNYFTNLDNLITLHQRKLDYWREMKKAMLQKMFI